MARMITMSRLAALFAIIMLVVTNTAMASAAMIGTADAPMASMPMGHDMPCPAAAKANCDACCIVAPEPSAPIRAAYLLPSILQPAFTRARPGFAVPPALPPPRLAGDLQR